MAGKKWTTRVRPTGIGIRRGSLGAPDGYGHWCKSMEDSPGTEEGANMKRGASCYIWSILKRSARKKTTYSG